jgi:uncharacterized protein (DUF2235 family)
MSKRILYCADGTWDTPDKHTNVYKLYKAATTSSEQLPIYSDGVGANAAPLSALEGGAFGAGLWQKIKDGYTKIAHAYEKGDSLYLFGFSRGAYTARSLAGMIAICGLPTKDFSDDLVNTAFDAYRQKDKRAALLASLAGSNMDATEITMVGVWDTVGALGIPSLVGKIDPILYGFLNTDLNPKIRNAYQALAIDERRAQFQPTFWTAPAAGQTMEQVWFVGVHSDIGGGEPPDGAETTALSDITLGWMMCKAKSLGITFDAEVLKQNTMPLQAALALDKLHTSWTIVNGLPLPRTIDKNAVIANSVMLRCQHDHSYRPANLTFEKDLLAKAYGSSDIVAALAATAPVAATAAAGAGTGT